MLRCQFCGPASGGGGGHDKRGIGGGGVQEQSVKIQAELAATTLEGYSEDETVCVTMSGNQARYSVLALAVRCPPHMLGRSGCSGSSSTAMLASLPTHNHSRLSPSRCATAGAEGVRHHD